MPDIYTAMEDYLAKLEALKAIRQCLSTWNADRSSPGYLGTRCDRVADHSPGEDDGGHRARVPGSSVVVTW